MADQTRSTTYIKLKFFQFALHFPVNIGVDALVDLAHNASPNAE